MRRIVAVLPIVLACVTSVLAQSNTVVFDNQSGEPALVKLIGPTAKEIEVPTGSKGTVSAAAGHYRIKVRYGVTGNFRYAKGEEFEVTETATARSETTITLHTVVAGNYASQPSTQSEFEADGQRAGQAAVVPEKSTEQYEEADVDALSIYLETEIKSLVREADGTLAGVDAVVAKFTIADMPVELITNKIGIDQNDRHFATISTKQFGTIRLTLSQFGGGTVWLTSSQKRTVLSLRAAQALGAAKATTEGYSQRWVAETKARRLVAYLTKRASGFDLNIVGLDGSNQKRVTDGVQDARDPRWSPDGRYLAFAVYERSGKRALWRVNADGSGMLRLIECASGGVFPVWAPDGLRIAYEQKNGEMHVIDSDGKNDRRLTESADHFARAWSPDGSLIAFDKFQGGTFRVGYIMTNGTEERVLPEGAHPYAGEDSNPSFSNDGKHILFQSDRDGATAIFVFDTESSTLRRLTSPTHRSFAPTFVPIGGRVVVSVKW